MTLSKPSNHQPHLDNRGTALGLCALLAAAVLLVFGRTLKYDFVNYDDDVYFYANSHVQAGLTWPAMAWACTTGYNGNWHPLTWLSFMSDVELFGPGPAGPHLTNVLLHAANTVLLLLVLRRLTGSLWRSSLVAALFGLHPLHVESVAWISERKDVLSGLFFMLTLLCYARAVTNGRRHMPGAEIAGSVTGGTRQTSRFYWLSVLFFALGLMSKPMLVTVPFVLLLLDFWPLKRISVFERRTTDWRVVGEKIPFFLLSALACVTTIYAQPQHGVRIEKIPLEWRMENAVASCFVYLEKTFYPSGLTVFYPYSLDGMSAVKAFLGVFVLVGICLGFILLSRNRPYLLVGWLWYLGMLVPVIGLVQIARHAYADRYTYLPLIGVFILLVWGGGELFPFWRQRRRVFGVAAVVVVGAVMVGAAKQTAYWRNSESLWTHALACTTGNYIAHNNLGLILMAQGNTAEALDHYQRAIEINPSFAEAHQNLGVVLAQEGQSAEAIRHFKKAIELQPDCADAYNSIGNVLANQGRLTEAITNYETAVNINRDFAAAHYNLGNALALQGKYAEAIAQFQAALQLKPDDLAVHNSLAAALALQNQSVKENGKQSNP